MQLRLNNVQRDKMLFGNFTAFFKFLFPFIKLGENKKEQKKKMGPTGLLFFNFLFVGLPTRRETGRSRGYFTAFKIYLVQVL